MIFKRLDRVIVVNNEMNQANNFWEQLIGVKGTIINIAGDGLVDFAADDDDLSKPCTIFSCDGVNPDRFALLPSLPEAPPPRLTRIYRRISCLVRRIV